MVSVEVEMKVGDDGGVFLVVGWGDEVAGGVFEVFLVEIKWP